MEILLKKFKDHAVQYTLLKQTVTNEYINEQGNKVAAYIQVRPVHIDLHADQVEMIQMLCNDDPAFRSHLLTTGRFLMRDIKHSNGGDGIRILPAMQVI
jgi:hypothetical protein